MRVNRSLFCIGLVLVSPFALALEPIVSLNWAPGNHTLFIATQHQLSTINIESLVRKSLPLPKNLKAITDITLWGDDDGSPLNNILISSEQSGLYTAPLATMQWQTFNKGLNIQSLQFVFTNVATHNVMYAANQKSIFKYTSEDNWQYMGADPLGKRTDFIHSVMPGSMGTGWIFTSTATGLAFSADCFCLWRNVAGADPGILSIANSLEAPSTMYTVTATHLKISLDGGKHWAVQSSAVPKAISALVQADANTLFAGTQTGEIWQYSIAADLWQKAFE